MEQLIPSRLDLDKISAELKPVLAYWERLKPEDSIGPAWRDFDLIDLPAPLLPRTLVVDVEPETRKLSYRYFGTQIAEVFGADRTGKIMGDFPDFYVEASNITYGWVIDERCPVLLTLEYVRQHAKSQVMEILRLPLSDTGSDVTHVASSARFFSDRRELSRLLEGEE